MVLEKVADIEGCGTLPRLINEAFVKRCAR